MGVASARNKVGRGLGAVPRGRRRCYRLAESGRAQLMERISDLRIFLAVASEGSFAAASRKLGLSPAVVTRRISALESELSLRLFQRTTRAVSLTESGELFRDSATKVIDVVDEADASLDDLRDVPKGSLAIAASPTFAAHLTTVVRDFCLAFPKINVRLWFDEQLVDLVKEGFDLAVRIGRPRDSSLIARRILLADSVLCASPGYLDRRGMPQHPDELRDHDCLVMQSSVWRFSRGDERFDVPVSGRFETNTGAASMLACANDLGIGMAPDWAVADLLEAGALVRVLDAYQIEPKGTEVNVVYPARNYLPPKVRLFVEHLSQSFAR